MQQVLQVRVVLLLTHECDWRIAACFMQIPGVPIMFLQSHRYSIERLPEATMGGAPK